MIRDKAIDKELDELITLAEKVSENVNDLEEKYFSLRNSSILYFALGLLGSLLITIGIGSASETAGLFIILCFIAGIGGIWRGFYDLRKVKKIKRQLLMEKKILEKLFNMSHNVKELTYNSEHMSEIEKALIEMRLGRIKFS